MVEDITTSYVKKAKKERNYVELIIRQYKPILFGFLSCVSLILALSKIVDSIFYIVFLTFLVLTLITIVTGPKQNTKKIRLD
ncbi:MAG: hypothetical protein ACTSQF_05295 [Candidatus Heimdallarchaeaceae archaeon]